MSYLPRKKKKKKIKRPVHILFDDREKSPWKLGSAYKMTKQRLLVGDYTIKGFEDILAIEKKNSLQELLTNLSGAYRKRFKIFLHKLSGYDYKYILVEDSLENTKAAVRACRGTRLTEESLYFWIAKIVVDYGIPVIFLGNKNIPKQRALDNFFCRIVEKMETL